MRYKRMIASRAGGPQVLALREEELAEPEGDEVRIRILAAGIAFADVVSQQGKAVGAHDFPFTPGQDLVGIVEKCGPEVRKRVVGDIVAAYPGSGCYSQYLCLPERETVLVPGHVDPVEAVCMVLNYITAYQMLHRVAQVKAGERILVHGAAGGVGTALLQLGSLLQLEMYGTVSHAKRELVESLGAIAIDYHSEDFLAYIRHLPGGGVDAAFDAVGGQHLWHSFQALRRGGRLVGYGFTLEQLSGGTFFSAVLRTLPQMAWWSLLPNGKRAAWYAVAGPLLGMKNRHPEWFREDLTKLIALLAEGKVRPVVAACVSLEEAAHAHELLERGLVQGKLVLLPHASSEAGQRSEVAR